MSHIAVQGEQSTDEEIEMITELYELDNSATDEFIRKVNGSFVNAEVNISLDDNYLKLDGTNIDDLVLNDFNIGSILFIDSNHNLAEDNANLNFDDDTNTLTVGNITGTDLDLTLGTGDISTSGTLGAGASTLGTIGSGAITSSGDLKVNSGLIHLEKDQDAITEIRIDNDTEGTGEVTQGFTMYDGATKVASLERTNNGAQTVLNNTGGLLQLKTTTSGNILLSPAGVVYLNDNKKLAFGGSADTDSYISWDNANTELDIYSSGGLNLTATALGLSGTTPYFTLTNTTFEDTEGGSESKLIFNGFTLAEAPYTGAMIQASNDGGDTDQKTDLIFYTNDGSDGDTPTEAMRIDSSRNITANVTSNITALGVGGVSSVTALSCKNLDDGSGHEGGLISLISKGWGEWALYVGDITNTVNKLFYGAAGFTTFKAYNSGVQFANVGQVPLMTILNGGNVGIGETAPDTKLEIFHAGTQLKLSYDASNYITFATQSDGDLTIDSNKTNYVLDFGDGILQTGNAIQFTQTDGNEYIDSLADGYMDYGATTGHRFNNDITTTGRMILDGDSSMADYANSAHAIIFGEGQDSAIGYDSEDTYLVNLVGSGDFNVSMNLKSTGRLSSGTMTITASSDNTDVSGINTLFINPGAAVVIGGFAGGVDGQVLHVIIVDADQAVTFENEEATGTQKLAMHESSDETITNERAGFTFVFNSTTGFWHDVSHARHV